MYSLNSNRLGTMSPSLSAELVSVLDHHLSEELFILSTLNFPNAALSFSLASYHHAPDISTTLSVALKPNTLLCSSQILSPSFSPSFGQILLFYILLTL